MPAYPQSQAADLPTAERARQEIRAQPKEEWAPGQGHSVCSRVPCCVSYCRVGTSLRMPCSEAVSCQFWHTAKETKTQRGAGSGPSSRLRGEQN